MKKTKPLKRVHCFIITTSSVRNPTSSPAVLFSLCFFLITLGRHRRPQIMASLDPSSFPLPSASASASASPFPSKEEVPEIYCKPGTCALCVFVCLVCLSCVQLLLGKKNLKNCRFWKIISAAFNLASFCACTSQVGTHVDLNHLFAHTQIHENNASSSTCSRLRLDYSVSIRRKTRERDSLALDARALRATSKTHGTFSTLRQMA